MLEAPLQTKSERKCRKVCLKITKAAKGAPWSPWSGQQLAKKQLKEPAKEEAAY